MVTKQSGDDDHDDHETQAKDRPQVHLHAGHSHGGELRPTSARVRRILAMIVVPLIVMTLVATAILWPTGSNERRRLSGPSASRSLIAAKVTSAERDSAIARVLKNFKVTNIASLPAPVRASFSNAGSTFPPLLELRVLRDGTLWILPTAEMGAVRARWDVFSKNGQRLGRAMLPIAARVWDGAHDWILVSELGEDDAPSFVRYRVSRKPLLVSVGRAGQTSLR